jgi:2-keto-4-pentenoate hydratase/2-oxohepta-3-ene-1,7-dioic acid hydratase in catechol pathway
MDAARAALQRDDAWNWRVPKPRILTPLFPRSLLSPRAMDVDRRIVGPEQPVPWPPGAAWLDYEPMVAAVVGNEIARADAPDVPPDLFGYTLVSDWRARSADGAPVATAEGVPISIGPCVVTVDELEPQAMFLQVKVDDREMLKGNLNGTAASLAELIASVSQLAVIERGDAFALGPFPPVDDDADPARRLWPGALVELSAEGIGTLRNRIAAR